VYTTFHSTILHWRNGSENESTYADARRIFTILEHDLGGIPNDISGIDARQYFRGDDSSMEMITVIQPMDLENRPFMQPMQVTYRLSNNQLIREERKVEGPLKIPVGQNSIQRRERPDVGRKFESIIADGVIDCRISYIWTPSSIFEEDSPPTWVELFEIDFADNRLPDGLTIEITLYDPAKDPEAPGTRFRKTFIFDGATSRQPLVEFDEEFDSAV